MEKLKYISLLVFATIIFIVGESHALPKDIQAIIDTAKNSHLTKEMHQTYWDWMDNLDSKNEKDSLAFTNLLSNWYPKINRLQLQFNREFMKSLKLTIKNKKITYSDGYEESYQKMKKESLNLPLQKGTKEYADAYRGMIESFKQSKDGVDQMFQYAALATAAFMRGYSWALQNNENVDLWKVFNMNNVDILTQITIKV